MIGKGRVIQTKIIVWIRLISKDVGGLWMQKKLNISMALLCISITSLFFTFSRFFLTSPNAF